MQTLKKIPKWGWLVGLLYFVLQYSMYRLADFLSRVTGTINWAFCPKIPAIDDAIPLLAPFVVIYIFSYVFWICGPIAVSLTSRRNFTNYIIGLSCAYVVGFLIFLFAPTFMDRGAEGLMEAAAGPGLFNKLLSVVYSSDGSQLAFNLFPSYHCLISLYCYLGVRRQPEISRGFRIYSLIMTVLICMSTVFTKQHYAIDIVGGLSISLLCYFVVGKLDPGKKLEERRAKKQAHAA